MKNVKPKKIKAKATNWNEIELLNFYIFLKEYNRLTYVYYFYLLI
jgi:hypothetical protein